MPMYKVTENDFVPLDRTSFEAERLLERGDMQRRLRYQPEILEEGLLILSEEYGDWEESNRRVDLLALDSNGRLVVIEIKRSDMDSLMDLQAIRYAAMVARMTFRQAAKAHSRYLGIGETEAESRISQHLTGDDEDPVINSDIPRKLLVSANFSKELTTSVLWLRQTGVDITCVKLQLYKSTDGLFMESSKVIPIPEESDLQVQLRNREEDTRPAQSESSRPKTFAGSEQFQRAIESARRGHRERLEKYYELALSLQANGLAELSTRSGSYNTVLRVRFPGGSRGLVNVFKNDGGWGYLQFNVGMFDRRAPNSKGRLEEIIGSLGRTHWGLEDGFLEALFDAYREANGQLVPAPETELPSEPDQMDDLEETSE